MSQEKKSRNKRIYRDHLKGMTYAKLSEKYGIKISPIQEIVKREKRRAAERFNISGKLSEIIGT